MWFVILVIIAVVSSFGGGGGSSSDDWRKLYGVSHEDGDEDKLQNPSVEVRNFSKT